MSNNHESEPAGPHQTSYYLEGSSNNVRATTTNGQQTSGSTTAAPPLNRNNASLNEKLQVNYIDVADEDDSMIANMTRRISRFVGSIWTPGQVLGILRVLKAVTLAFVILNMLSNLMYIIFVELAAPKDVRTLAGGPRDIMLRLYGLVLSFMGLAIELDYGKIVKKFAALKGFLPRAFLYFFIAQITGSHPGILQSAKTSSSSSSSSNSDNDYYSAGDDDDVYEDPQIPSSAVGFQRVTSFVLSCCALGYLACGMLCFDRFTARAFLSNKDPRVTTAIPSASTALPAANANEATGV